jgi:hypothetical protein
LSANEQATPKQDRIGFILTATAVALVVFMLVFIPINPLKKYKRSVASLESTRQQLDSAVMLRDAHLERLRNQEILMKRLNERKPNFDLWGFVNSVLTEEALRERANLRKVAAKIDKSSDVSSQLTMVELGLTGVSLKELANVLHKVYSSNNLIVVYRMLLRPENNEKGLTCEITFLSPNSGAVAS